MAEESILAIPLDPRSHKGVWILAEVRHGRLMGTAFELLGIGGTLARDLGEDLCAVIVGSGVSRFGPELFEHGADKVYALDDPSLDQFVDEAYARLLVGLIARERPNKFLLPASIMGRSLASRVAVSANTGLTADVTSLSIDREKGGLLNAVRPSFGGTLMATILCPHGHRPEMATVRPMAFEPAKRQAGRSGKLVKVPVDLSGFQARSRHLRFEPEPEEELDITQADVVVAGGRGAGPEGFKLIEELAKALGGAVGATRSAVDSGLAPYRRQIGLTGRVVRPKLYIAAGISGQIQHLAGMNTAGTIVCVNTDPEAPLMKLATFAVVGDCRKILAALAQELEKSRAAAVP